MHLFPFGIMNAITLGLSIMQITESTSCGHTTTMSFQRYQASNQTVGYRIQTGLQFIKKKTVPNTMMCQKS
jgi:hypothetical protein